MWSVLLGLGSDACLLRVRNRYLMSKGGTVLPTSEMCQREAVMSVAEG